MAEVEERKVVIVGDSGAGKSALILTLSNTDHAFPDMLYIPRNLVDQVVIPASKDGVNYSLEIWDTAGSEDYNRLRPLIYPQTDLFVILYSIANLSSYEKVIDKWIPEITLHAPGIPWILMATKVDLRDDQQTIDSVKERFQRPPVTTEEGQAFATHHGAAGFLEVSAISGYGLQEAIEEIMTVLTAPGTKPSKHKKKNRNKKAVEHKMVCTLS